MQRNKENINTNININHTKQARWRPQRLRNANTVDCSNLRAVQSEKAQKIATNENSGATFLANLTRST